MEPVGYAELLEQVKVRVRTSRVQAARAVNVELVGLYWQIGRLILGRQESEGWGTKVIGRLAADLRAEFPGMRGLSSQGRGPTWCVRVATQGRLGGWMQRQLLKLPSSGSDSML